MAGRADQGFARLESALLAEALTAVSGRISDAALKSRAQKHRLGLALLALHRGSVRGTAKPAAAPDTRIADKVTAKLIDMHRRMRPARDAG